MADENQGYHEVEYLVRKWPAARWFDLRDVVDMCARASAYAPIQGSTRVRCYESVRGVCRPVSDIIRGTVDFPGVRTTDDAEQ